MATGGKFGCGDFLPGYGPDNFQDYNPPIDQIDEPDDPPGGGITIDPVDGDVGSINPTTPPPPHPPGDGGPSVGPGPSTGGPGGPAPPGGGGGGGGPDTPGPPGPQPPGVGTATCKCVIEELDTTGSIVPGGPAGFTRKKYTIQSKCRPRGTNQDTGNR